MKAAWSTLSMSMDEKARIGSSALEHVISGFAMEKSTKICEKKLCKNARIPALGYGAVEDEEDCPKAP